MCISDILFHLGEDRENYFNAVSPPVIQSSNFAFRSLDDFRNGIANELTSHIYTRGNNPTTEILRKKLAALENTDDALVFGSGAAAIAAAVIGCVRAGDHIVSVCAPYSWTTSLMTKFLTRFGVETTFVDGTDAANFDAAIRPNTKVMYLESPNSLTFELQDLGACAEIARRHGLVSIIDNSYASPIFQRPADYGIDLIVHSGTKYLNGHSDVVVGALCGRQQLIQKIFDSELMTLGAILAPHDANLVIRGLRTLSLRMARCHQTAQKVVDFLAVHPRTRRVVWPHHVSFPQQTLALQQMSGCGGLFSVEFDMADIAEAEAFFNALRCFTFAVSWGGHESLVFPTCAFYNVPGRPDSPLPFSFYRFYIGLEDADFLIADQQQALDSLGTSPK